MYVFGAFFLKLKKIITIESFSPGVLRYSLFCLLIILSFITLSFAPKVVWANQPECLAAVGSTDPAKTACVLARRIFQRLAFYDPYHIAAPGRKSHSETLIAMAQDILIRGDYVGAARRVQVEQDIYYYSSSAQSFANQFTGLSEDWKQFQNSSTLLALALIIHNHDYRDLLTIDKHAEYLPDGIRGSDSETGQTEFRQFYRDRPYTNYVAQNDPNNFYHPKYYWMPWNLKNDAGNYYVPSQQAFHRVDRGVIVSTSGYAYQDLQEENALNADINSFPFNQNTVRLNLDGPQYAWGGNTAGNGAGILTSQHFGKTFFSAGTNRRAIAGMLEKFLCQTLREDIFNTNLPPNVQVTPSTQGPEYPDTVTESIFFDPVSGNTYPGRVGRDVTRTPSGSGALYRDNCAGCHKGLDGLRGAFYNWDFRSYIGTSLGNPADNPDDTKYGRNRNTYPAGYRTVDNSYINYWTREEGSDGSGLGFRRNGVVTNQFITGNGARQLGSDFANSQAFSSCMTKRAFRVLCGRNISAANLEDLNLLSDFAQMFESSGYKINDLFAEIASSPACVGR